MVRLGCYYKNVNISIFGASVLIEDNAKISRNERVYFLKIPTGEDLSRLGIQIFILFSGGV